MKSRVAGQPLSSGRSTIMVGGVSLETLWQPAAADPGLTWVLLHEGLGSIDLWRDFPQQLHAQSGSAVFAWSRQGYGRSDAAVLPRPLDYMQKEAARFVGEVLDCVPGKQIALLGHSDGASIAALYAGLSGDPRVAGVVLVAPHFFTEQLALHAIADARRAYEGGELRSRLKKYHFDNVDCAFRGWNDAWLDPGFVDWNIEHCLPGIRVPMGLVQGDRDTYGTTAQLERAANLAAGPVQTTIIPDCDHWPHREAPQSLLDVCEWLEKKAI